MITAFGYKPTNCEFSSLGNGLINNTFLIKSTDSTFVLQCLNRQVFPIPSNVINNANLISAHLQRKVLRQQYPLTPIYQLPNAKNSYAVEVDGEIWRGLFYIPHCFTLESINNTEQASAVANAFAQFTAALSDFDCEQLSQIIVQFHDLAARSKQLQKAITCSTNALLSKAKLAINFIQLQEAFFNDIAKITSKLPKRVTHNDTKINNLLFSQHSKKPVAVIDLDTCMAGFVMHDYGDMIRTCCISIAEDSPDLNDMTINFEMLTAMTHAYIAGFNGDLSRLEQQSLLAGLKLMPFMLGIRFLTDFLNGDKYFKTSYPEHNLVRAKNQLHLYKLYCQHEEQLTKIVLAKSP